MKINVFIEVMLSFIFMEINNFHKYSLLIETGNPVVLCTSPLIIFLLRNFVKNKIIKSCNGVKRVKSKEGPHHIQMTISNCRRIVNWSKVAQKNFRIHFISLYSKDMTSIVTCKYFLYFCASWFQFTLYMTLP